MTLPTMPLPSIPSYITPETLKLYLNEFEVYNELLAATYPPPEFPVQRTTLKEVWRSTDFKLQSAAAKDTSVPIIYGRDKIGGRIFAAQLTGSSQESSELTVGVAWCLGEAESIDKTFISDVSTGDPELDGLASVTNYLGTSTQAADPILVSAITDYSDDLVFTMPDGEKFGTCYSVFKFTAGACSGFPNFNAIIKGRKVYDPREGAHDLNDKSTWEWSNNPALHLADFVNSTNYGADKTVVWSSVSTLADRNDKIIDVDSSTVLRTNNVTLDKMTKTAAWVDSLRAYAACFMYETVDGVHFIADAPAQVEASVTASSVVENSFAPVIAGSKDNPTVVRVKYTDITDGNWQSQYAEVKAAGVSAGTVPRIESIVEMPGINSYQQAAREALIRFKHFNFEDLSLKFTLFDEGLRYHSGMVIHVSNPCGVSQNMRVQSASRKSTGRWDIACKEYQESSYTSALEENPLRPDTNLPSPYDVPAISGLEADEEIYQLANGDWSARIRIKWDDPPSAYAYPIEFVTLLIDTETGKTAWQNNGSLREIVTPPLKDLPGIGSDLSQTYNIRCYARSSIGIKGDEQQIEITTVGKTALPSDVASISGYVLQGVVYLTWTPSYDLDVRQYIIRYGATKDWDTMTALDKPPALHSNYANIPEGDWWFAVKAQDSLNQFSENAAFVYLEVDHTGVPKIIQTDYFSDSTLPAANVHIYKKDRVATEERVIVCTGSSMSSVFNASALNTFSAPMATYRGSETVTWLSKGIDLEEMLPAKFTALNEEGYALGDSSVRVALLLYDSDASVINISYNMTIGDTAQYACLLVTGFGSNVFDFAPEKTSFSGVFDQRQEAGSRATWAKRQSLICGSTESWIVCPESSAVNLLDAGYTEKTFQAIFQTGTDVSGLQSIIAQGGSTAGASLYIYANRIWGNVFASPHSTYVKTPDEIKPENQYHAALRFESSVLRLAVNGVSVATASGTVPNLPVHAGPVAIGANIDTSTGSVEYHFTGKIFRVSQNNAVLTDHQVSYCANIGWLSYGSNIAQFYDVNTYSGGTAARDLSSYANHGSIATASAIDVSYANFGRCVMTQHPFYYRESITLTPEGVDPRYFTHSGLVLGGDKAAFCVHGYNQYGSVSDASVHWEFRGA